MNEKIKGRGAQLNTANRFLNQRLVTDSLDGIDEPMEINSSTQVFIDNPKTVVNKITSPDVGMMNTINPYQGCEHGCIYCYARNAHEFYGFSAGLDFEQKIIVKPNAAQLLRKHLSHKNYKPEPITFSGNTDCYQPLERKYRITRSLLEVMLECRNPVGIITKNSLILRDIDLLQELAKRRLVHVMISITSLCDELRQLMEPRTATYKNRLHAVSELSKHGIPAGIMNAPIIPGLNSNEIPDVIKEAAGAGALTAGYIIVRLNGAIGEIFHQWLYTTMPDAADRIWNNIKACHGGSVNDSRFGKRISGDGKIAESIKQLFHLAKRKYLSGRKMPEYNLNDFRRPVISGQQRLFD